jgi:hypothetical protein
MYTGSFKRNAMPEAAGLPLDDQPGRDFGTEAAMRCGGSRIRSLKGESFEIFALKLKATLLSAMPKMAGP